MKRTLTIFYCFAIFFSPVAIVAQNHASIIIYNGKVAAPDGDDLFRQAIAISGSSILAVGSNEDVQSFKTPSTKMIDAGGRTVIPGLYDSHLHVVREGRFYNTELRWDGVKTLARALQMLREQAARTPKGQWVRVVGGWNEYQFAEKRLPTLKEINDATGDVPCYILYLYDHAYVNKAGLKVLGYDKKTPPAPQGLMERDIQGNPTGLLVAEPNAYLLYYTLSLLPAINKEETLNSSRQFMTSLNSLGVTAALDAGGGFQNYPDDYWAMDSLSRLGQLTLHLPYYLFAQKGGRELEDYKKWSQDIDLEQQDTSLNGSHYYVEGAGENLVMTAADFEKFGSPRPELSSAMEAQLKAVLTEIVSHKWPFRIHGTYNESITRFLNVIEELSKQYDLKGIPWIIDHGETISEENLHRIKALGGALAIQDRMAFQGEIFVKRYGLMMANNAPPIQKIRAAGIPLGMGTDGTRVSSYNPWLGLYWLVSGKTVGGTKILSDNNRLSKADALKLFTQGSASIVKEDGKRGRLAPGFAADVVILNKDYFTIPEDGIKDIQSLLTIFNGQIVWGDGPYKTIAPKIEKAIPAWSPVNFYDSRNMTPQAQ